MKRYEAYKDSGVDWIGEIPEGWDVLPGLSFIYENKEKNKGMVRNTVLSLSYGKIRVKAENELTGLVPESFETYQLVNVGDLIFRPTDLQNDMVSLRSSISDYEGIITSAYLNLRFKKSANPNFFHYFFRSIDNNKIIYGLGSGLRQNISYLDFRRFLFPFPPLPVQTAIAEFLDDKTAKIDQLIGIKQKEIELLKERRQILIQKAVTKGLDDTVKLKDSGVDWIGEIPEHWEVRKLKQIGIFINGYAFESAEFKDAGVKVMKISNVQTMKTDWSDLSLIDSKYYDKLEKFRVLKGDLVFALTRPIISTGIKATIIIEDDKILLNQRNSILRTRKAFDVKWFYFILLDNMFIQEFENNIDKTGQQPNISTNRIGNIYVPFPNPDEILHIISYLEAIEEKISKAILLKQQEIEKLKEYKTVLIDQVVTGKVRVS